MENEEKVGIIKSFTEAIQEQITTTASVLSRPVVQRQVLAALLILIVAWLLTRAIRRWLKERESGEDQGEVESRRHRWLEGFSQLIAPAITLVLLFATIALFHRQGYPSGLLEDLSLLFWIWLFYALLLSVLYARFGDAFTPYHHRLLTPIFIILITLQIVRIIPGFTGLAAVPFGLGSISITMGDFFESLIVLYFFLVAAWIIEQVLNQYLPGRIEAEKGVVQSISTLARYLIIGLGIVVSLGVLGLNASSLALIAGGLSVGIGIGLQELVANFVSGMVLLFEQSLRPGDIISMEGQISEVQKISLRATTVRTLNNEEVIVPNAAFTTNQVTTLTKTERLVRILLPIGVSYKSDPIQVKELVEASALQHTAVLAEPMPVLLFRGYGDSSLNFELSVWINRPESLTFIKSDLYYQIFSLLKENGIEIPFPQRDLHLKDGWEKMRPEAE